MKITTLLISFLLGAIVIGCATKEQHTGGNTGNKNPSKIKAEDLDSYSTTFATYLQGFEKEGETIPAEFISKYITPVIERNYGYPSTLRYTYRDVLYKNDNFVAVTFTVDDDEEDGDVYVKFLTTIDLKTEEPIRAIDLAATVYTEGHANKGFNTTYIKEMVSIDTTSSSVPLIIECQFHYENDNYNTELVKPTEQVAYEREAAMIHDIEYLIDEQGEISEKETIHE